MDTTHRLSWRPSYHRQKFCCPWKFHHQRRQNPDGRDWWYPIRHETFPTSDCPWPGKLSLRSIFSTWKINWGSQFGLPYACLVGVAHCWHWWMATSSIPLQSSRLGTRHSFCMLVLQPCLSICSLIQILGNFPPCSCISYSHRTLAVSTALCFVL